MRMRFVSLAGTALILSMAAPALAHHGWGGYEGSETDVSGIVERLTLGGPHATIKVRSTDGKVWDVILSPPYLANSVGINERTVPVGASVKAQGSRHSDASRSEIRADQLTMGQKTIRVYSGRN
jgi:hypothetical protein